MLTSSYITALNTKKAILKSAWSSTRTGWWPGSGLNKTVLQAASGGLELLQAEK
jgi:hypothetical protein